MTIDQIIKAIENGTIAYWGVGAKTEAMALIAKCHKAYGSVQADEVIQAKIDELDTLSVKLFMVFATTWS